MPTHEPVAITLSVTGLELALKAMTLENVPGLRLDMNRGRWMTNYSVQGRRHRASFPLLEKHKAVAWPVVQTVRAAEAKAGVVPEAVQ
ncbi:hypothetical protein D9M70_493700 [compost metagenome]